jgi:hypothetical protein
VGGIALKGDQEEGLVASVVDLGDTHRTVKDKTCLAELVVIATGRVDCGVLVWNLLVVVGVEVSVLKDIVSRAVIVVGSVADDSIGDSAISMTDLRVEDGGLYFDLLYSFRRYEEPV